VGSHYYCWEVATEQAFLLLPVWRLRQVRKGDWFSALFLPSC